MKIGFAEFLRATIERSRVYVSKSAAFKPLTAFSQYTTKVVPRMEQEVEVNFLREQLKDQTEESIKNEVISAFLRRRVMLQRYQPPYKPEYKKTVLPDEPVQPQPLDPVLALPVSEFKIYHAGKYAFFLKEEVEKFMKGGMFGYVERYHRRFANRISIMARPTALKLIEALNLIREGTGIVDLSSQFKDMSPEDIREYINNEYNYPVLFFDMAKHLKEVTDRHWGKEYYQRVFGNSVIQDAIINELLRLAPETRNPLAHMEELVQKILKIEPTPSAGQFKYKIQLSGGHIVNFDVNEITVPLKARFYQDGPSFKNFFLHGESGAGKSMILNYISLWASKAGYLVINVRDAENWTRNPRKGAEGRRLKCGLFAQNAEAKVWLQSFLECNSALLEQMAVSEEYGKVDYAGVHKDEYNPVPNIYYKERETFFNEPDKLIDGKVFRVLYEEERILYLKVMNELLPSPQSLAEICRFGIANEKYAINAIGEVLNELKRSEVPIMMCVDNFNFFYRPTAYRNYKYQNEKYLRGCIPPNHLALCRLFMNLNGHEFRNGVKVVASSRGKMHHNKFRLGQMYLPQSFATMVPRLSKKETEVAVNDLMLSNVFRNSSVYPGSTQHLYVLSQGNWHALLEHILEDTVVS